MALVASGHEPFDAKARLAMSLRSRGTSLSNPPAARVRTPRCVRFYSVRVSVGEEQGPAAACSQGEAGSRHLPTGRVRGLHREGRQALAGRDQYLAGGPAKGPPHSVLDDDLDPTAVAAVLMGWLAGSREQIRPEQARGAVTWLSDTLNIDATDATYAAGFIGHPDVPDVTFNEGVEHYGGMVEFALYMILLSGALVATVGDGDPGWLRQFDL